MFMMFVLFTILVLLMLVFYKYLFDIIKYFKLDKSKAIKYLVFFLSIIIFIGSFVLIFINKWASIFSVFILYLVLMIILIYIVNMFLNKNKCWKKMYLFIPILLSLLIVLYGYINMRIIVPTTYDIHNEKLNEEYKIVLIADLHYGVSIGDKKLKKYCDEISKLNPDIVILAGDIVDERTTKKQMEYAFETLGSIKSNYGIFYTYGNHDKNNYSKNPKYNTSELAQTISDNNINILEEQIYYINDDLVIIGRALDNRKPLDDLLAGVDNDKYLLLVDHIAQEYVSNLEYGINLELSGHTHAGQIFPVGIIERIFKTSDSIYGISEYENFYGIVTSGMGGWSMPIRTEKHSEYVIINLSK
jgi:predicted MPP superfamily phosphohydrolase